MDSISISSDGDGLDVVDHHTNASDGGHQKWQGQQLRHEEELLLTGSAEVMRASNENPCILAKDAGGACEASNCNAVYNHNQQPKICPIGWRLLDPLDVEKQNCSEDVSCPGFKNFVLQILAIWDQIWTNFNYFSLFLDEFLILVIFFIFNVW